jgi:hypothetical protein
MNSKNLMERFFDYSAFTFLFFFLFVSLKFHNQTCPNPRYNNIMLKSPCHLNPNFKASSPTLYFDPLPFLGIYDAPNIRSNINLTVLLPKQSVKEKPHFHTLWY